MRWRRTVVESPLREDRVRTPLLLQMEMVECGAAALGIVLGYFGRFVPLATLRTDCGVSRDGSKASSIVKAAQAHGLVTKAFKKELHQLSSLRYPYIVFWNFNHFLVVEGCRNGMVYLNDPDTGPRRVSLSEFDAAYTGVVLVMQPGPTFEPCGRQDSIVDDLRRRLAGSTGAIGFLALTAFLLVVPSLAVPALIQVFVDKVLVERAHDWGRPLVLGLLLAAALRVFLTSFELRVLRRFNLRLATQMSAGFVWRLLRLPASYYAQRYPAEVSSRIALNDRVSQILSGELARTAIDTLMIALYLVVMAQYSFLLTAIACVFAAANFAVLRALRRWRLEGNQLAAKEQGRTTGVELAGLQSIRTLKASGLEDAFYARWAGCFTNAWNAQQRLAVSNATLGILPRFLMASMNAMILGVGAFQVMQGRLTVGQLIAFQSLAIAFVLPVHNLVGLGAKLQELETDLCRLNDVLANPPLPEPRWRDLEPSRPVRLRGALEFRDVTFGHNSVDTPLIRNLSFRVAPGRRIAFVGASGSGKSTVARLAAGLYQPAAGQVLVDDVPLQEIPADILSYSRSMVEQDIVIFHASVQDNLTLWDNSIPEQSVTSACRDALIDDVIRALPNGYQTVLLEDAANLSGGQKQRLEIARALAIDPSLLILDEATSALDAGTEHRIDRNIRRRGCTCLIVAHRLSTIRDADEIIVLDQGRIVQRGNHEQLIRQPGPYAQLLAENSAAEAAV